MVGGWVVGGWWLVVVGGGGSGGGDGGGACGHSANIQCVVVRRTIGGVVCVYDLVVCFYVCICVCLCVCVYMLPSPTHASLHHYSNCYLRLVFHTLKVHTKRRLSVCTWRSMVCECVCGVFV